MPGRVKEESWDLNSNDTTAIPAGSRSDGTASKWSDIWKYQVPTGQAHILKPGHHFSAYLEDASAEVGNGTCRIKIVVRDQSEQDEKAIYGPALYVASKDFDDITKMAKLALQNDLAIEEKFFIVLQVYDDGAIDESDSYFNLETIRVRSSI
ncbi:MAG: hypothetical protein JRC93_11640 [Deltaproteobacteria bacterium]|nr:hypothetical protein [Deltaproteobacteria bacterium]MBW2632239.1 hypothetical protein [Deltaproteobacteria bacterium]